MAAGDDAIIERCAQVADEIVAELDALIGSGKTRKGQYDRQSTIQLRVARRWCARAAVAIRKLKTSPEPVKQIQPGDATRLDIALRALRELRPMVDASRHSVWRSDWLQRIDEILASPRV